MIRHYGRGILVALVLAAFPAFPAEKRVINEAGTRIIVVYWDMKNQLESVVVEKGSASLIPVKSAEDIPYGIYVIYDKPGKDRPHTHLLWCDQWNTKDLEFPVYKVDDKALSPVRP